MEVVTDCGVDLLAVLTFPAFVFDAALFHFVLPVS